MRQATLGATTLICATSLSAPNTPWVSSSQAVFSTNKRAISMSMRALAMRSRLPPRLTSGFPKATRDIPRSIISFKARSAAPISRIQWCTRPGPSRPCAISKPLPMPAMTQLLGRRTFSKCTSPCPYGASKAPNTGNMRVMVTPGASNGTSTIVCCWYLCAVGSDKPIKMATLQFGWPMPVLHHFLPFSTMSSPASVMVACMLVASLEATSGSVMQNAERISPASSGVSHCSFWASLPYFQMTSILPVSGALQLNTSGAISDCPVSSASGAYSALLSPLSSGRKRFQRPSARAFSFSASMRGSNCQVFQSGPASWAAWRSSASKGKMCASMNCWRARRRVRVLGVWWKFMVSCF